MPHLTLPRGPDGFVVEVLIGLDGATTTSLHAAAQPIPPPLRLRGVLDTGTDKTSVAARVPQHFGLVSLGSAFTHTAAGQQTTAFYQVSLTISGPAGVAGPMLVLPTLTVTELGSTLPNNIEALIGADVLSDCLFISDGPGRQFILAF